MQLSSSKRYISAASLANLSLLRVWSEVLSYTPSDSYIMKLPPGPGQLVAIFAVLGLLTAMFSLLLAAAQRWRAGKVAFMLALALPVNAIREVSSHYVPYLRGDLIRAIGASHVEVLAAATALAAVLILLKFLDHAYRVALAAGLLVAPLLPLTLVQGIWAAAHYDDARFRDRATAPAIPTPAARRVVWLVFDELDQRLAFEQRPAIVAMPEFGRFQEAALHAAAAYSPTSGTLTSLPSLISGRLIRAAVPQGPDELRITYADDGREARWSDEPNVFSRARAMGFNTGLIGWYHPYCRQLNGALTTCWWAAMPFQADSVGRTAAEAAPNYVRSLFETTLLSPFGQSLATHEAARRIRALLAEACRAAADPSLGLVFVHLQVPHAPHAYDRRKGGFNLKNAPVRGYLDSLALADVALGQLRRAMEKNSVWNNSTVLISSDHSYRSAPALSGEKIDRRVPFLLKLSGQRAGREYVRKFNSVLSADLVLSILENKLRNLDEVIDWMNDRVSHGGACNTLL